MSGPRLAEVFPRLVAVDAGGAGAIGLRSLILLLYRARGRSHSPYRGASGLNARSVKWFRGNGTFFRGGRFLPVYHIYAMGRAGRGLVPHSTLVAASLPFIPPHPPPLPAHPRPT